MELEELLEEYNYSEEEVAKAGRALLLSAQGFGNTPKDRVDKREEVCELLGDFGLSGRITARAPDAKHIFTHKEWHMIAYRITLSAKGGGLSFATRDELQGVYALPSAFRAYTTLLLKENR